MVSKNFLDASKGQLSEKAFIQDNLQKNPFPFWIWFVVFTILAALFWGGGSWYSNFIKKEREENPFLQVTNRQFSLFLWQFPEYMRINSKVKQGYLPGFQYNGKVSLVLSEADNYVAAPPTLIFLYHTWDRLLSSEFTPRPIPVNEFKEFLDDAEEWKPQYWPKAPPAYATLIKTLDKLPLTQDLEKQKESTLPIEVKQAFQGWKNYFKEGEAINKIRPSNDEMRHFLEEKPHYNRNFWKNIVEDRYPTYLKAMTSGTPAEALSNNEIPPFLRVAFFNYSHAESTKNLMKREE